MYGGRKLANITLYLKNDTRLAYAYCIEHS